MTESKKGMSAQSTQRIARSELQEGLYLCHRIRRPCRRLAGKMECTVEMDETWIAAKSIGDPHLPPKTSRWLSINPRVGPVE